MTPNASHVFSWFMHHLKNEVLKYIRGSKFLDRVIISSFHWFQNIEVRGWEVQMGASLSLAFTQRRNHLSDFCFFPSTFWLLCQ